MFCNSLKKTSGLKLRWNLSPSLVHSTRDKSTRFHSRKTPLSRDYVHPNKHITSNMRKLFLDWSSVSNWLMSDRKTEMFCATADCCEIYLIKMLQLNGWICTKNQVKTAHWLPNRDAEFLRKPRCQQKEFGSEGAWVTSV